MAVVSHIDTTIDPGKTLGQAWAMQPGIKEYDISLLGLRCSTPRAEEAAIANIRATLGYLIEHKDITFHIKSADVFKPQQRTGFVFDPKAHKLIDSLPVRTLDGELTVALQQVTGYANILSTEGDNPSRSTGLRLAYDDAREARPLFLDAKTLPALQKLFGRSINYVDAWDVLYKHMLQNHPGDENRVLIDTRCIEKLYQAWQASKNQLVGMMDERAAELRAAGVNIPEHARLEALEAMQNRPVYVGMQADELNEAAFSVLVSHGGFNLTQNEEKRTWSATARSWPQNSWSQSLPAIVQRRLDGEEPSPGLPSRPPGNGTPKKGRG